MTHTPAHDRHPFLRPPLMRGIALLLLCSSGCSHPVGNAPPASSSSGRNAMQSEQGAGTRAKGEVARDDSAASIAALPSDAPASSESKDKPSAAPEKEEGDDLTAPASPNVVAPLRGASADKASGAADLSKSEPMMGLMGNMGQGAGRLAGGAAASAPKMRMSRAYAMQAPAPAPTQAAPAEFNTENYHHVDDHRFVTTQDQPLSTFSIDVDTASYSNARRFFSEGSLPPADAIRVEEWLNYFSYDYAPPTDGKPFSVHSEVSRCPWNDQHELVRIGIKGQTMAEENVPPRNLVFLIDVSGSMMDPNKLPLVKQGLSMLVNTLRAEDSISMVVYAGASGLVLPPTSGKDRGRILSALGQLEAGGSTNGGDGIRLAYQVAQQSFHKEGINRVILATDGDFNVGTSSEGELQRLIEDKRKGGVFLTVLGFGTGNTKDSTMEMLADKGNGNYAYIDTAAEAQKVLVREAGSTLVTIAKDVKLQVEFNPAKVQSYKLVGYENRTLAKEDFNDDKKDAGEIGAGHTVTALYEIVPVGAPSPAVPSVDPLKYQAPTGLSHAASSNELMTVAVRYKLPKSDTSTKFSVVVSDAAEALEAASADYRFGAAVAEVAMILRNSPDVERGSLQSARALAQGAVGKDPHGDRAEFLGLVDRAMRLRPPAVKLASGNPNQRGN
ncbi:MAG TPA: von Willebrand factor type A domain-containing protein [Polyangiaceae bacterium]|nr:von Willebrand factor type A domain-containing protein [Polyangiaceae bacterium]